MPSPIDPAERLLNLLIALVNSRGRMTKEQVRASVAGYADAPSDDAFERMFERDKDTLRELGIPLVTVTDAGHGDDIGYRIDLDAYALPPIDLTAAELGVLTLAAQTWQDRTMRGDTSRALTKLRAVGQGPGATDLVAGLAPRVRSGGSVFAPLLDAAQARQLVRLTYRAASTGEVRERRVEPWQLVARRGGWVLVGWDQDREAPRSFRLSRIEGSIRALGEPGAFPPPDPEVVDRALAAWRAGPPRVATLAVLPERAEATRVRAVAPPADAEDRVTDALVAPLLAGRDVVHVEYRNAWELAEELVGYGDAVLVIDPPEVRGHVLSLLRRAAALASQADEAGGDGRVQDDVQDLAVADGASEVRRG
ncbi:helix-turn-helix transcriptional regulator [Cellulomonas palmilytica]|uniref:helix-turn-helix transcriptional regulator n=1 Tax=Cellulomonas palmilytica TaxID=2608402 RepID=UPI001F46AD03|nr:WYL domain-containing protein [Cellulomonas palmilytica]UJP38975.1 WYL domain-containing protein [Cellulomonas palmilytica]